MISPPVIPPFAVIPNQQRTPCPVNRELGMTVCVAAICNKSRTIVTASDRLLSWGHTSSDTVLKLVRLQRPYWLGMIAGDDITVGVDAVAARVRERMSRREELPSIADMQTALRDAWRDVQNEVGAAAVLNPFRLTVPAFVKDGKRRFGEAKFYDIASRLEHASRLQSDLLVCGFDEKNLPALLVCTDEGCRDYSRGSYMAIGSGAHQALASLAFHEVDRLWDLDRAIYHVCVAKFMAEKSIGVGPETMVLCLNEDGKTKWIFKRHIELVRRLWKKKGRPRDPSERAISETLTPILNQQEWQEL